jgi:hypothetical protein
VTGLWRERWISRGRQAKCLARSLGSDVMSLLCASCLSLAWQGKLRDVEGAEVGVDSLLRFEPGDKITGPDCEMVGVIARTVVGGTYLCEVHFVNAVGADYGQSWWAAPRPASS